MLLLLCVLLLSFKTHHKRFPTKRNTQQTEGTDEAKRFFLRRLVGQSQQLQGLTAKGHQEAAHLGWPSEARKRGGTGNKHRSLPTEKYTECAAKKGKSKLNPFRLGRNRFNSLWDLDGSTFSRTEKTGPKTWQPCWSRQDSKKVKVEVFWPKLSGSTHLENQPQLLSQFCVSHICNI